MFLTQKEALYMTSRSSSLPWLFPLKEELYPDTISRVTEEEAAEGSKTQIFQKLNGDALVAKGSPLSHSYWQTFYLGDPLILRRGGPSPPPALAPPPVRRLW